MDGKGTFAWSCANEVYRILNLVRDRVEERKLFWGCRTNMTKEEAESIRRYEESIREILDVAMSSPRRHDIDVFTRLASFTKLSKTAKDLASELREGLIISEEEYGRLTVNLDYYIAKIYEVEYNP